MGKTLITVTEGAPKFLSYCMTCKGRLKHVQETLTRSLHENTDTDVEFVLVDYDCPDDVFGWVSKHLSQYVKSGKLRLYKTFNQPRFRMAHAKNCAHRLALGRFVCNLDADNIATKEFTRFLRAGFKKNPFAVFRPSSLPETRLGGMGRVAVARHHFDLLRGYDEDIENWGHDDGDMERRLIATGAVPLEIPASLLSFLEHDDSSRLKFMTVTDKLVSANSSQAHVSGKWERKEWIANKDRDWGNLTDVKNDIAAITCFFNPAAFKNNLNNYLQFKDYMRQIGCPLYSVELAFGDSPFELEPDEFTWQIRTNDVMWHKERLLNLVEKRVPERFTKIIWTDSDLVWPDQPDWFEHTSRLLDRYKIVQPYSVSEYMTPHGAVEFFKEGVISVQKQHRDPFDYWQHHPGFVWAARREFFTKFGLYDRPILGAGDAYMAFAFLGNPRKVLERYTDRFSMCSGLVADFMKWAEPVTTYVNGSVSFVATKIQHKWHGSRKERRYHERMSLIKDFLPERDLVPDSNGLWAWSDQVKPEFKRALRDYFPARNEDSLPEERSRPRLSSPAVTVGISRDCSGGGMQSSLT